MISISPSLLLLCAGFAGCAQLQPVPLSKVDPSVIDDIFAGSSSREYASAAEKVSSNFNLHEGLFPALPTWNTSNYNFVTSQSFVCREQV